MQYRTLEAIVVSCGIVTLVPLAFVIDRRPPPPTGLVLLDLALGVALLCVPFAMRALRRRAYLRAARGEDASALRRAYDRYAGVLALQSNSLHALEDATVLAREQRWREAAAALERVHANVPAKVSQRHARIRAFVLAHLGYEAMALELIGDEELGTRGIVLQRLGRSAEAREALSVASVDSPRAPRLFYLAEAERALGRTDAAIAAYEKVLALPGESPWHRDAREALNSLRLPAAPFR